MTMADEKRYFSVKDMFEQAVTRAKTDPRYEEYSKICELDYDLLCSTCKYDKLYRCEFDVVGEVTYGSSEGIYGDIFLYGNWSKERDDPFKSRARVYVLKTLKQDKESYLAVGMLVNLICYYYAFLDKARELTGISIEAFCAETPYDIGMAMYKLNEAYQDKFSFYIYYQDELKTLDEWIRETDLSESFYFGGTLDYHF